MSSAKMHLQPPYSERFVALVGEVSGFGTLRNHIAHNRWMRGTRPGSIRPTLIDIRQGRADAKGFEDEELDYTSKDFAKSANALFALNQHQRPPAVAVCS